MIDLSLSYRNGPSADTDKFRRGQLCGPPPHKRIACVHCHEWKGIPWTRGRRLYCNVCRELIQQIRGKAMSRVHKAVAKGTLKHPSDLVCVDCGAQAAVYDHRAYENALNVVPVCKRCNVIRGPAAWSKAPAPYFLEPAPL